MDIQLCYTEQGKGEIFILLHGNGESKEYFHHQIHYFSKKYRVIAVDTRGHGQTPRGTAPFTIRQFAEDLFCFMEELGIESANLLGFSDGGNIVLVFALKYPEKVKRLILNGANLNGKGVKPSVQIPIILGCRIASFFARRSTKAKNHAEMLGLMVYDPDIDPEELKNLKRKTLVIAGKKDMIKQSHTNLIYEKIPDAQLVILPGGHFIANKNPEAFNIVVENFLEE